MGVGKCECLGARTDVSVEAVRDCHSCQDRVCHMTPRHLAPVRVPDAWRSPRVILAAYQPFKSGAQDQ